MTFLEYLSYKRIGLLAEAILPSETVRLGNYTVWLQGRTEGGPDDYLGRTDGGKQLNVLLSFDVEPESSSPVPEVTKDQFVYLYHFLKNRIVAMVRQEKPDLVNLKYVREKLEEISKTLHGMEKIRNWKLTLVLDKAIDIAVEELNKGSDEGYVLAGNNHDTIVTRTGMQMVARGHFDDTNLMNVSGRNKELESKESEMEERRKKMSQAKSNYEKLSGRRRQRGYYSSPDETPAAAPVAAPVPTPTPTPTPTPAPAPAAKRRGGSWFS